MLSVFFQHFDWEISLKKIRSSPKKKMLKNVIVKSDIKLNGLKSNNSQIFKHPVDKDLDKDFHTSPRLYKSKVKYYTKEIETKPNEHKLEIFYIKFKNFVCSPKTYFVFETVSFLSYSFKNISLLNNIS